jgi:hypothetical protein
MIPTGFVAIQPRGALAVKLHLVREDQTGTVCGRYTLDRILPENASAPQAKPCGVCMRAVTK